MMTAFIRTLLLYFILMTGLRVLGKRQIGELEPGELVMTMMLSDLAAVPMQDFGLPLLSGIIPILTLLSLSMLLSFFSLRSIRFRQLVCGTPTVLIKQGKLQQKAMLKNRFTIDELMEELRLQGYSSITDIKYAILENSGQLSILPWQKKQPVTPEQIKLNVTDNVTLPTILISDGRLLQENLTACGKDKVWLQKELQLQKLSQNRVFLLTIDENETVVCIEKEHPL
jgi:uncharacterized membrane protein YcaP (DUF421 family)